MKFPKIMSLVLMSFAVMFLLFSPYSVNVHSFSKDDSNEAIRQVAFFNKDNADNVIQYIKNTSIEKDDSLINQQKFFENNKLIANSFDLDSKHLFDNKYTDIAYPVSYVQKNPEIQSLLNKALDSGKMVYLYGDLSLYEYKDLLGLDKMNITFTSQTTGKTTTYDLAPSKNLSELSKSSTIEKYDIIGFSTTGENQIYIGSISTPEGVGKNNHHYVNEIVFNVANDMAKNMNDKPLSLFNKNVASATIRDTNPETLVLSVYDSSNNVVGRIYTDWSLDQLTDESVSEFDYFILQQSSSMEEYNGWLFGEMDVRHDIPYSKDELVDSDPDSNETTSWSISFGYPWSVSYSFNTSSEPKLTTKEYTVDPEHSTFDLKGINENELFEFHTAWKSSTDIFHANIDTTVYARFDYISYCCSQTAEGSETYNIDWFYDSSKSPGY